jgi:hypothetical protein
MAAQRAVAGTPNVAAFKASANVAYTIAGAPRGNTD